MDGDKMKRCNSLATLVERTESNLSDLKNKLNELIKIGKEYNDDIVSPLIVLLRNNDPELLRLTVQTIAELSKCEEKRSLYAQKDIISPIVEMLNQEITSDRVGLVKQCYRALGNLCCDSDEGRQNILDCNLKMIDVIKNASNNNIQMSDIPLYFNKCMLNFVIGGPAMSELVVSLGIIDYFNETLERELREDDLNDDLVHTALLVLSVINDNAPEIQFSDAVIKTILNILKETTNMEISEVCLDTLHMQAEHDSVKTLMAREGAVQLLTSRLELLISRSAAGDINADDAEVKALMKKACDLLIIILTGDEAMNMLYNNGLGESYLTMIRWLDTSDYDLLTTAVFAIGNFARSDSCCTQMMEDKIFDKLLNLFEVYHGFSVRMAAEPDSVHPIDAATVSRVQHAILAALRNLAVPAANKRVAAAGGKAAPVMLKALPKVNDHNVAYKLLAAIRMLVDGQEGVAKQVAQSADALAATVRWGQAVEHAGAAGEAPRLIAWTIKHARSPPHCRSILEVDGCVSCLVNMLVSSHAVMQNEAILALTLLAIEALNHKSDSDNEISSKYEEAFAKQLIEAEAGKHVAVLVETNCAKMPVEVAENLLAFLDITSKKTEIAADFFNAKVQDSIKKMMDSRKDFGEDMRECMAGVASLIERESIK